MSRSTLTRRERAPLVTDAIPPPLRRRGISQCQFLVTALVGALLLALFASRDTPGWAERLGDTAFDHQVRNIVGAWDGTMERLGLTGPHDRLRDAMQRALDWQWQ
ncbi:MAG TPA: hypothetical protein VN808_10870 [Stellaceae bacterium]|nr:hypothetical protein [Stellaceae bacterium]